MILTIENQDIRLAVNTLGAQMMSIRSADGCEYLWQGDSAYWADRAPTLFPFIGRLTGDSYKLNGKIYPMGIHGFAAASEFAVAGHERDHLTLLLQADPQTKASYPFDFALWIIYKLEGSTIAVSYRVENKSSSVMPFGIGGHPGFRVPLEDGEVFDHYRMEFSRACQPDRVGFTPAVYLSGHDEAYPLEDGKILPLRHDLFDEDAIILKNMARQVKLCSDRSSRSVTVSYPDMPYLGIWHWPKTDAPYVCIEPWSSLPARQDVVEEFTCKSDLIHLAPGKTYETVWTISITV